MADWIKAVLATAALLAFDTGAQAREPVDVALVLAVDVSRSMSVRELEIQREGYAAALNHPDVVRAVAQGAYGRIAITMFEWAGTSAIRQVFDWTLIETGADADRLSEIVRASRPVAQRRTSISGAILHAVQRMEAAPYDGFRKVIDVSGDGPNNQGAPVLEARQIALSQRIVINGLPLMTRDGPGGGFNIADLDSYYADCVIGGPGSFLVPVNSWEQFPEAIRRKLVLEIGAAPDLPHQVIPAQALPGQSFSPISASHDCLIGEKIWEQRQWMFDDR
ncbi:DUF1194 domain-containing protein [Hoeflea ulvae]|uniref:DUF1194 domain-containing protein n=1 Tax=Hoeflea ulvae TaxID=2983764 RepID=A0ABT3YJ54_9HYPH|nr:DUF1194 domain-containing protein [Hoeflea ulvae]MCY0095930.1 DUF1194 domain-containing protein [Hoeflea ulvae]